MIVNLNPEELDLAEVVLAAGEAIQAHEHDQEALWVEDHTPPDSEDDVLPSLLYTRPGDPHPTAGFTLHRGFRSYKVTVEPYPEPAPPDPKPGLSGRAIRSRARGEAAGNDNG